MTASRPLFARALGATYERLPEVVRAMHDVDGVLRASGRCSITRGTSFAARLVCAIARMPPSADDVAITVEIAATGSGEVWSRSFDGHRLTTRLGPGPKQGFKHSSTNALRLIANNGHSRIS